MVVQLRGTSDFFSVLYSNDTTFAQVKRDFISETNATDGLHTRSVTFASMQIKPVYVREINATLCLALL